MTETKLAKSETLKRSLTNSLYKIYTSCTTANQAKIKESALDTAIAIRHHLQHYIHDIQMISDTAIYIDFFFPQNNRTRIIAVYLPSNNSSLSKLTQHKIASWIHYSKTRSMNIIVLGDFNSHTSRKDSNNTTPLFKIMEVNDLISTLQLNKITEATWRKEQSISQIDDIWVSAQIANCCSTPIIEPIIPATNSDHANLILEWQILDIVPII